MQNLYHCKTVLFKVTLTKLIILFPAIATVVTVAEILKNNGFAVEKSKEFQLPLYIILMFHMIHCPVSELSACFFIVTEIRTSTVEINDESRGRAFQKAKVDKTRFFFVPM